MVYVEIPATLIPRATFIGTSVSAVNLPGILSLPSLKKKPTTMPFAETIKHDLNTTVNEMVQFSALYYIIGTFGLEKMIYQPDDSAIVDALKSAGIVVGCNELLRLARRMGWSIQVLK